MKLLTTLIILSFSFALNSQNLTIDWIGTKGTVLQDHGHSIVSGSKKSSYVAGYQDGNSQGNDDIFIQKLDSLGNTIWSHTIGSNGYDRAYDLTLDASENIYVTGHFSDTVDFDPGVSTNKLTGSHPTFNLFVLKLDSSGNFIWAKSFEGGGSAFGSTIFSNKKGKIYLSGNFSGTIDFDPNTGTINKQVTSSTAFLLSLNELGSYQKVSIFNTTRSGTGNDIDVDKSGNVYLGGVFNDTTDFDPGINTHNEVSLGSDDNFILKLDSNLNFDWVRTFGSKNRENLFSLTVDEDGNVYTTGYFSDSVDFDPDPLVISNKVSSGSWDIYVNKFDSTGDFKWVNTYGNTGADRGGSIKISQNSDLYLGGTFFKSVDFNPAAGVDTVNAGKSRSNIFIQKLDLNGNHLSVKSFGKDFTTERLNDMDLGNGRDLYITGAYDDTSIFLGNQLLSIGQFDAYFMKLKDTSSTISVGLEKIMGSSQNDLVEIFPNPTTNFINVRYKELIIKKIELFDLSGKLIFEQQINNDHLERISLDLDRGVYLLVSSSDKRTITKKIIIQ